MAIRTRTVLGLSIGLCSLTAVLAAGREQSPGVFIDTKDVTLAEMAEVKRLAGPTGKEPWLVYGFRHGRGTSSAVRHTSFEVYLQPDVENGGLRRGRMLRVDEPASAAGEQQAPWRIESTSQYAQVGDVGRLADKPIGRRDPQRPFVVDGAFEDQTLVKLVALIRSHAPGPNFGKDEVPDRIAGSLPITAVRRTGTSIEVTLTAANDWQGEYVTLEERDGGLVVVNLRLWIV